MAKKPKAKDLDEDEDGEDEGGPAKKGPFANKKLLILGAVGLVVLLAGAGAGLYFTGIVGGPDVEEVEEKKADANAGLTPSVFHELPEILVDLKTSECRIPFIKLKVRLAVTDDKDIAALKEIEPFLIDKLKVHLRGLEPADLRGVQGAEKLRFDILTMIEALGGRAIKLRSVLFKELILQ
jgi:flagellar FliL protein